MDECKPLVNGAPPGPGRLSITIPEEEEGGAGEVGKAGGGARSPGPGGLGAITRVAATRTSLTEVKYSGASRIMSSTQLNTLQTRIIKLRSTP